MINLSKIQFKSLLSIIAFSLVFLVLGCEKEKVTPDDEEEEEEEEELSPYTSLNRAIYEQMEDIYLWNDSLPDINPSEYDTPEEFLAALRYQPLDKWSFIMTTTEFNEYFGAGEYLGHGFMITLDDDDNIRIGFVYKNTQSYREGIRRSWIIKKVNGTDATAENVSELLGSTEEAITNTILFLDTEGNEQEISLTKETVEINTVLHSEIIEQGSKKIGYMVFETFISTAIEELEAVFEEFKAESIDELIIDLRYNGGGMNTVAEYIGSWIGGNRSNSVFYKLIHNENNESRDVTVNFTENAEALDLSRIFFITTGSSASASELLINGLTPYYDVNIVGSTTGGKPVGMYTISFTRYNYTLAPISFKYVNADDYGDFYDGLSVDYEAEDDKTRLFGDQEESSLKTALSVIAGETVSVQRSAALPSESKIILPKRGGLDQFLKAY